MYSGLNDISCIIYTIPGAFLNIHNVICVDSREANGLTVQRWKHTPAVWDGGNKKQPGVTGPSVSIRIQTKSQIKFVDCMKETAEYKNSINPTGESCAPKLDGE